MAEVVTSVVDPSVSVAVAVSWSVKPAGKELLWLMAMLTTLGAAVDRTVEPVIAELDPAGVRLAVTVALPAFLPVASAELDTVKALESEVLQVASLVRSLVVPSL